MSVLRCSAAAVATVFAIGLSSGAYAAVPTVTYATHQDESRPMRDIIAEQANTPYQGSSEEPYVVPNIFPKPSHAWQSQFIRDLAQRNIQDAPINIPAPTPSLSVLGLAAGSGANGSGGAIPPDTNGDVSPAHYTSG